MNARGGVIKSLDLSDLEKIEAVSSIRENFHLEISDEDADKIKTVQDAIGYIEKHE